MKGYIVLLFLLSVSSLKPQDSAEIKSGGFIFNPSFAGGQVELVTILFSGEVGALIDIDFFKKEFGKDLRLGVRFGYEHYDYFEPGGSTGGSPFTDYSAYFYLSVRTENFHVNPLAGLGYHTREKTYYESNEILPRIGIEIRYNFLNQKVFALILKGSTSFEESTGYFGLGFAMGIYW